MVDNNKLIEMVKERRALWDMKYPSYHNRDIAKVLWQEIAEEMNTTEMAVKARWQNLRDIFRREHNKSAKMANGGSPVPCSWKHYNQLLFIADMVNRRKSLYTWCSPLGSTSQKVDVKSEDEDNLVPMSVEDLEFSNGSYEALDNGTVSNEEDPLETTNSKVFKNQAIQTKKQSEKSNETEAVSQFLQLEMRKMEQLERMQKMRKATEDLNQDEDYHFLMSLLPHLREIPKNRKLAARMRLQQVLIEESEIA